MKIVNSSCRSPRPRSARPPRVLAVASAGGHWVQLFRLRPAWKGCTLSYLTTNEEYRQQVVSDAVERAEEIPRFFTVIAANRWQKFRLVYQFLQILAAIGRVRPDVVVTTGAAPGYLAVRVGRWVGARTVWVDSIANAQELSLSGMRAGPYSGLWLTQWEHLAASEDQEERRPVFRGATL